MEELITMNRRCIAVNDYLYLMEFAPNNQTLCLIRKDEKRLQKTTCTFQNENMSTVSKDSRNFYTPPYKWEKPFHVEVNTSQVNNDLLPNGSCNYYLIYTEILTFSAVIAPILVILFLFFSLIPITVFMKKRLRCPSSILLTGIAISDVLFAVSLYLCTPYLYIHYNGIPLSFPLCAVDGFLQFTAFTFHSCSVTITTILGIQKISAIVFPFWSRIFYTKRTSCVCVIVVHLVCFLIFTPVFLTRSYYSARDVGCTEIDPQTCLIKTSWDSPSDVHRGIHLYFHITKCIIFEVIPCLIILISTVYLTLILNKSRNSQQISHTVIKRNNKTEIRCHMSPEYKAKQRRSSILILLVLVMFIIAEFPNVILSYLEFHSWLYKEVIMTYKTKWIINQVHNFILLLKVIVDMVIYISMSELFRSEIKIMALRVFKAKKHR